MIGADEALFRLAAGVFAALFMGLRLYYQFRSRKTRRIETRAAVRDTFWYWAVALSVLLIFLYAFTGALDLAHVPLPTALRWFGVALAALSLVLFAASHEALGRNWSGILEVQEEHSLIVSGPYRYVRHPMYTAFFASAVGAGLMTANALVAGYFFGSVLLMYRSRVDDEEKMMLDRFGDAYRDHMRRTGRLFPRLAAGRAGAPQ